MVAIDADWLSIIERGEPVSYYADSPRMNGVRLVVWLPPYLATVSAQQVLDAVGAQGGFDDPMGIEKTDWIGEDGLPRCIIGWINHLAEKPALVTEWRLEPHFQNFQE